MIAELSVELLDVFKDTFAGDLNSLTSSRSRIISFFQNPPNILQNSINGRLYHRDFLSVICDEIHRQSLLTAYGLHIVLEGRQKLTCNADYFNTRLGELSVLKETMAVVPGPVLESLMKYTFKQFSMLDDWQMVDPYTEEGIIYFYSFLITPGQCATEWSAI